MKPTKEQLADPRWWDENANGYDYVFYLERNDEYIFADDNGEGINFKLIVGAAGWKLLAKRPDQWVPEVGVECCGNTTDAAGNWSWQKVELLKDMGNGEFACYTENKILRFVDQFRPIKTQREELIDIIAETYMNANSQRTIADAILARFDLTEKDGE